MNRLRSIGGGLLLWMWVWCWAGSAQAHLAGVTDTLVEVAQPGVRILYTTSTDNLAELPQPVWGAPEQRQAVMLQAFEVTDQGRSCPLVWQGQRPLGAIQAVQFELHALCADPTEIRIRYRLFENAEHHENFVRLRLADRHQTQTLSAGQREIHVPVTQLLQQWQVSLPPVFGSDDPNASALPPAANLNPDYLTLGIEHILAGWDHLAFLLGLLLLPVSLKRVIWMATAFTLAHSLTLIGSTLDWISPPVAWVEWLIAFSIAVIALENAWLYWRTRHLAWPDRVIRLNALAGRRGWVSFGFGLIHGFGFSYVLKEIGLGGNAVWSLALFNLGVEIGQVAVILLVWPLLNWLFRQRFASRGALALTGMTGMLGVFWMVQRLS